MTRRYLAFDIETTKDIPGEEFNWRAHRPLGISCAATLAAGEDRPLLWHGKKPDGSPAPRMSRGEARALLDYLVKTAAEGYRILTWNGLGFDFDVLAEESGAPALCRECALGHVDMMFHVFCALGHPVGLDKAAQGMGLRGKPPGMTGAQAPSLWAAGRFQQVLDYVAQDVRCALEVAETAEQRRKFSWMTRKGAASSMPLPQGWLSVREALKLPLPETSWMKSPLSRRDFTAWLGEDLG